MPAIQWRYGLALFVALAVVMALGSPAALSRGQTGKGGETKPKRLVYVVKHGSAKELAQVLGKFFKTDVDIQAVTESGTNALLITVAPGVHDELMDTLAKLDHRPQSVAVDVWLLDVIPRKDAEGKLQMPAIDDKGGNGPADRVEKIVKDLEKSGHLEGAQHFQLVAVENQSSTLTQGGNKPYVTGISGGGGKAGGGSSINYKNIGTTVTISPRIGPEKTILVDVRLDDSRMAVRDSGILLGLDSTGLPVFAAEFTTATLNTKLTLTSGQAAVTEGVQTTGKTGAGRKMVIVGARLLP